MPAGDTGWAYEEARVSGRDAFQKLSPKRRARRRRKEAELSFLHATVGGCWVGNPCPSSRARGPFPSSGLLGRWRVKGV